jgi:hypothetical protein
VGLPVRLSSVHVASQQWILSTIWRLQTEKVDSCSVRPRRAALRIILGSRHLCSMYQEGIGDSGFCCDDGTLKDWFSGLVSDGREVKSKRRVRKTLSREKAQGNGPKRVAKRA